MHDYPSRFSPMALLIYIPMIFATSGCEPNLTGASKRKVVRAQAPNILVILADDLGWGDVGYHGSEIRTPNIDKLAREGIRLDQFYAQPVCTPTRVSLMTGRYPFRSGWQVGVLRPWDQSGLPLEEITLAQELKRANYETVIIGKWHLGLFLYDQLPLQRGFDHHYGFYSGSIYYYTHKKMGGLDWNRDGVPLVEEGYATELFGDEAVRVINEHKHDHPLFIYLPFNAPHTPLNAPRRYINSYSHIRDPSRRKYAAMVTCLDTEIGSIIDALDRNGMRDNTLILFFSDNGADERYGGDNGVLRGGKGSLYEGGIRVVAIASWPGVLKAGAIVREPIHMVDVFPTLLGLARVVPDASIMLDGIDAWGVISNNEATPHREFVLNAGSTKNNAIRVGPWKMVRVEATEVSPLSIELFHVGRDPLEQVDLSLRRPDILQRLARKLDAYSLQAREPYAKSSPRDPPPGYVPPAVWGVTKPATSSSVKD